MSQSSWVWNAGRFLLLAGALAVTVVVFAVLSARIVTRSRDVAVPTFVGHAIDDARRLAAKVELPLMVDATRRPDPSVPAGHIVDQDPAPGTTTRRQRQIRVWVAAGPQAVRMPAVVGQPQRIAELRLADAGLAVTDIAELSTASAAADVVVAQDPPPSGSGRDVRLLVNRGVRRPVYVMPDLTGIGTVAATDLLTSVGFRVIVSRSSPSGGPDTGVIAAHAPAAGAPVMAGEAVTLEVLR